MNLGDFINMSGYGPYVWSCYGLTLAALIWNVWAARRQLADQIIHARRRAQTQSEPQS